MSTRGRRRAPRVPELWAAAGAALALVLLLLSACTVENEAYQPGTDGATPITADLGPIHDSAADGPAAARDVARPEGALPSTDGAAGHDAKPCTNQTFYQDADGDAFGDPGKPAVACAAPAGHVANKLDCDDQDPAAHPGQSSFYTTPTKGEGDFDYDCDQQEEQEYPALASCAWKGSSCVGEGWSGVVPPCGQEGVFVECQKKSGRVTGCNQVVIKKIQGCR